MLITFNILNNAYFSITTKNGFAYGNFGTGTTKLYPNSTDTNLINQVFNSSVITGSV